MPTPSIQDKLRGSLIAGAVGDALGYPVEFIRSFDQIEYRYGQDGIREYDTSYRFLEWDVRDDQALFSDDTQMTLYTAEGLLYAVEHDLEILPTICNAYLHWLGPQTGRNIKGNYPSKLVQIQELNQRRAPGVTCITALTMINAGREPQNDSKGCGGIMRIAPIALYGATHNWPLEQTARLAGEVAEITHLHPMSTLSSACCAAIIQLCIQEEESNNYDKFLDIIRDSLECVENLYPDSPFLTQFKKKIINIPSLKDNSAEDHHIIEFALGGGWVAEDTLAIALFSIMRHFDSLEESIICSVKPRR